MTAPQLNQRQVQDLPNLIEQKELPSYAGWTDAGFCAWFHNVDLDSELLYNVRGNSNISSRFA